ncbi:hypothetical protein [Hymenobacter glacieicola]|uniref:Uncharacterized protein n=1 Tax=Hymenobacter glacieicola TaxID=1562124 RepID=A0ABQ1X8R2_9BACT|nr:hypothetical protein [Hymenobacter glacieicola]GGG60874.1 hypothetical protein GCM10011378_41120 [Hymenobacter glacieicola]
MNTPALSDRLVVAADGRLLYRAPSFCIAVIGRSLLTWINDYTSLISTPHA